MSHRRLRDDPEPEGFLSQSRTVMDAVDNGALPAAPAAAAATAANSDEDAVFIVPAAAIAAAAAAAARNAFTILGKRPDPPSGKAAETVEALLKTKALARWDHFKHKPWLDTSDVGARGLRQG